MNVKISNPRINEDKKSEYHAVENKGNSYTLISQKVIDELKLSTSSNGFNSTIENQFECVTKFVVKIEYNRICKEIVVHFNGKIGKNEFDVVLGNDFLRK